MTEYARQTFESTGDAVPPMEDLMEEAQRVALLKSMTLMLLSYDDRDMTQQFGDASGAALLLKFSEAADGLIESYRAGIQSLEAAQHRAAVVLERVAGDDGDPAPRTGRWH